MQSRNLIVDKSANYSHNRAEEHVSHVWDEIVRTTTRCWASWVCLWHRVWINFTYIVQGCWIWWLSFGACIRGNSESFNFVHERRFNLKRNRRLAERKFSVNSKNKAVFCFEALLCDLNILLAFKNCIKVSCVRNRLCSFFHVEIKLSLTADLDKESFCQWRVNTEVIPFSACDRYTLSLVGDWRNLNRAVSPEPSGVAYANSVCWFAADTVSVTLVHRVAHFGRKIWTSSAMAH